MLRRIKTKTEEINVNRTITNDILLMFTTFVSGFLVPFLVWLWAVLALSQVVMAQAV